jgi:hypothetical protein
MRNMAQKDEQVKAVYEAPRVLESGKIRFETMISSPGVCTPGFIEGDGMLYYSDCIENE